jgi:hypothetical protein
MSYPDHKPNDRLWHRSRRRGEGNPPPPRYLPPPAEQAGSAHRDYIETAGENALLEDIADAAVRVGPARRRGKPAVTCQSCMRTKYCASCAEKVRKRAVKRAKRAARIQTNPEEHDLAVLRERLRAFIRDMDRHGRPLPLVDARDGP